MNAVNEYLYEKVQLPEGEWLRREPRRTHPLIREAVREAKGPRGLFYDDDVNRFVAELYAVPSEPNDLLLKQLVHETYIAKGEISDEEAQAEIDASVADGYTLGDLHDLPEGRYWLRFPTTFVGRAVANFSAAKEYRKVGGDIYAKRARNFTYYRGTVLAKAVR